MKTATIHSELVNQGGIERLIILLTKIFNVDVIVGKYDPEKTFEEFKKLNVIKAIPDSNLPQRLRSLLIRYKFKKLRFNNYDFYIFHGGASLEFAKHHKPNLWYCHSPTKWLYQLYEQEVKNYPIYLRPLFRLYCTYLRIVDKNNVKHVDTIVTNSENIKKTVKEVYGRDATVINPPVNTDKFKFIKSNNFYLSTARLSPDKRVDIIVKAFQEMPDKYLIVASSGTELDKIEQLAHGYLNIKVEGRVSDERLADLYGTCLVTVCASIHEDFGMISPESMSAGKPVIAVGDMGFAESIIENKTGWFYDGSVKDLVKTINKLDRKTIIKTRKDCEKRAKLFSEKNFVNKLMGVIKTQRGDGE